MKKIIFLIIPLTVCLLGYLFMKNIPVNKQQISNMKLTSPAFLDNQKLPVQFTCQGVGNSPPLEISEVPSQTQSLVLILKDPDAPSGPFIHFTLWNIPPNASNIPEGSVPQGSVIGVNSIGKNFYFSPCPPRGQHHYIFYLFALDTMLTIPPEAGAKELEQVMTGHILGATILTTIYP